MTLNLLQPFHNTLNFQNGQFAPRGDILQRRLSDMPSYYAERDTVQARLQAGDDPLIYEVENIHLPEEDGHLPHCTTTIYAGKVGAEYFMTKGHFHAKREQGEVYIGLAGTGYLVLQTEDGQFNAQPMTHGTIAYVPPFWAHRTINIGPDPFIFLAVWTGDAGHDYASIATQGFAQLLIERDGQPVFIPNPHYVRP